MKFNIEINTDNDAYVLDPGLELARILQRVVNNLQATGPEEINEYHQTLYDINGNKTGIAYTSQSNQDVIDLEPDINSDSAVHFAADD